VKLLVKTPKNRNMNDTKISPLRTIPPSPGPIFDKTSPPRGATTKFGMEYTE